MTKVKTKKLTFFIDKVKVVANNGVTVHYRRGVKVFLFDEKNLDWKIMQIPDKKPVFMDHTVDILDESSESIEVIYGEALLSLGKALLVTNKPELYVRGTG
ncbi:MAG: hypothetical protein QW304_07960 [Thermoproteota archaeon]